MDPTTIGGLGAALSKFPIDLEKATDKEKLNYLLVLVYGMSGDISRLKEDLRDLKQETAIVQRDNQASRTLSIIAIILAVFACAGVIAIFLYLWLN